MEGEGFEEKTSKTVRTPAQQAAFEKAQKVRQDNILAKRREKEEMARKISSAMKMTDKRDSILMVQENEEEGTATQAPSRTAQEKAEPKEEPPAVPEEEKQIAPPVEETKPEKKQTGKKLSKKKQQEQKQLEEAEKVLAEWENSSKADKENVDPFGPVMRAVELVEMLERRGRSVRRDIRRRRRDMDSSDDSDSEDEVPKSRRRRRRRRRRDSDDEEDEDEPKKKKKVPNPPVKPAPPQPDPEPYRSIYDRDPREEPFINNPALLNGGAPRMHNRTRGPPASNLNHARQGPNAARQLTFLSSR